MRLVRVCDGAMAGASCAQCNCGGYLGWCGCHHPSNVCDEDKDVVFLLLRTEIVTVGLI